MKAIFTKIIFLFGITILSAGNSWSQTPDQLFQKGIMKEEGEGSLKEAIELYKSVADNTKADRALRAKALYQMGNCYEKLGQQEARKVYEKLVANYSEQTELVANAKLKLSTLVSNENKPEDQGIKINQLEFESYPSLDGEYLATYDWGNYPAVEMVESKTGKKWLISEKGDWTNFPLFYPYGGVIISPDNKQVAYGWAIEKEVDNKFTYKAEIHIANIDGSNNHIISGDSVFYDLADWSSDGKYLLVIKKTNLMFKTSEKEKNGLFIISVNDGKESLVSNLGNRKIEGASFTADGNYIVFNAQTEYKSDNYDIYSVSVNGGEIKTLVANRENDSGPFRVPGTNSMIYLSTHSGNNDLWEMKLKDGQLANVPIIIKYNLDISTVLHGIKNDGTIYFSTKKLYPSDIYTGKLDFENKKILLITLDVKRTPGIPIRRVLWSQSMNKVACFLKSGNNIPSDGAVKTPVDWIIKDLKTGTETRIKNDLKFNIENIYNRYGWWTPGDTSILIFATGPNNTDGLYEVNVKNGEYSLAYPELKMPGVLWDVRFSVDGEPIGYYSYDNPKTNGILEKTMRTDTKRLIIKSEHSHPISNTVISPDGNKMTYSIDSVLYIVDVNNVEDCTAVGQLKKNSWPIAWTADNQNLFIKKYNEEKKGMEIFSLSINDKSLNLLFTAEQLEVFKYVRKVNIQHTDDSSYLTMTMGSYLEEMWEMENLFTANK